MAQLYKVHGDERALCPFTGNCCYTDCAWLIPAVFDEDEKIVFYTCCMNNNLTAALMTAEQLEQYEEEQKTKRVNDD